MSQTDALLLEHWRRDRNAEAFRMLATRYAAMVYHTCRRILGNSADAEEVAQECFLVLASTDKPVGGYLAPWLHRVACNRALARLRAEQRRRDREVRYATDHAASSEAQWNEIQEHVDEAIAALPEKLRGPVVAYFLDGLSHEAVARTLGVPRSTVTYRIDRGVECLRKTLQARGVTAAAAVGLAGVLQANTAGASAPASLVSGLGKLALSGSASFGLPGAGAAQGVAAFWGAKTLVGAAVGLALVAFGGWKLASPPEKAKAAPVVVAATEAPATAVRTEPVAVPVPAPSPPPPPAAPPAPVAAVAPVQETKAEAGPSGVFPMELEQRWNTQGPPVQRGVFERLTGYSPSGAWNALRGALSGEDERRSRCQNNLKQLGLVVHMFRTNAPGEYFPMQRLTPGPMMFANTFPGLPAVAPDYLTDARVLVCPVDSANAAWADKPVDQLLNHCSYYYLGYVAATQDQFDAFAEAFRAQRGSGLAYDQDLETPGGRICRVRSGVERLFVTDANNPGSAAMIQSCIPVFIEEPRHQDPPGGNVLYLDGHVEFQRYDPAGRYPMNQRTLETLRALSR